MTILVTNNAVGALAASITTVATTITVGSGQGALFPQPTAGQFFYATLIDTLNNKEIIKVTARATNAFTAVRGQDGTVALAFNASDRVELRPVAAVHNNYPQLDTSNSFVTGQRISGAAATVRERKFQTANVDRWVLAANAAAEAGSNAGSDFELSCFSDAGALLFTPFTVNRATGVLSFAVRPTVGANKIDSLESGVTVPMRQATVPVGWTKDITYNDAALRIVSGTPSQRVVGGKEFTVQMAARTIAQANLPNVTLPNTLAIASGGVDHTHFVVNGSGATPLTSTISINKSVVYGNETSYTLGGSATTPTQAPTSGADTYLHTHAITGSVTSGGSGTALAFDVNYVDIYMAIKT